MNIRDQRESKRKPQSIKLQVTAVVAALLVGMAAVFVYSSVNFFNLQESTVQDNQQALAEQMADSISNSCEQVGKLTQSVAYNQIVQTYLTLTDPSEKFMLYNNVINLLNNTKAIGDKVMDIAVIGMDGKFVNLEGNVETARSLMGLLPEDGEVYFFGREDYHVMDQWRTGVAAGMWIYSLDPGDSGMKKLGAVFCVVDPSSMLKVPRHTSQVEYETLFWDRDGNLVLGNQSLYGAYLQADASGNMKLNGKEYLASPFEIPEMQGGMATLVSVDSYRGRVFSLMVQQYLMMGAVLVVVGFVLIVSLKRLFRSLSELTGLMHRIRQGNRPALKERLSTGRKGCLEAVSITKAFNGMLDEINDLNQSIFDSYTRLYEMEMAAKQSELIYLRSQINPHFLYNTLELICGMSQEGNSQQTVDIARALGNTLRYSVKGSDEVPLSREIEIIQSYLMIQTTRFEDRFDVEYQFAENTLNIQVPKMCLQPLVENAIFHGLEESMEYGLLTLGAEIREGVLQITVEDDGVGMDEDTLAALQESLKKTDSPSAASGQEHGIGLQNVNSRIRLYYGTEYGLTVDSVENQGTRVTARIPARL